MTTIDILFLLGEKIKKRRDELGLTLEALGRIVGKSKQAISKIESGNFSDFSRIKSTLILIAKALRSDFGETWLKEHLENKGAEEIRVVGRVAAGKPRVEFESPETIFIPSRMVARDAETFALQIAGDSMRDVGIRHGDLVILHKTLELPPNGTVVVVRIGDGEASEFTIKTWFQKGSKVTLRPENPEYDAIEIETEFTELNIEGKFAGLIRFGE